MESAAGQSASSKRDSEESKKTHHDREKAKAYIQSLKDIMHKQSEQLKKQQTEFKTMLSTLETQHFTARFHSVAFKLELEVLKLFEVLRKVKTVNLMRAFHLLKFQTQKSAENERFSAVLNVLKVKKAIAGLITISRRNAEFTMRKAIRRMNMRGRGKQIGGKNKGGVSPEQDQRLSVVSSENAELRRKLEKLRSKTQPQTDRSIQDLIEENQRLREKVQATEQNVGMFIKEMASLLDQHEPPVFRPLESEEPELVPRPPSKVKKVFRPKIRTRVVTHSPERAEEKLAGKKQGEKRRLQFD